MPVSGWVIYWAIGVLIFLPSVTKEMMEVAREMTHHHMDLIPNGEKIFVGCVIVAVFVAPLFWPVIILNVFRK